MTPDDDVRATLGELGDGATVAVGGLGSVRRPMGLLRALVASGVTDLVVVSFLGGLDVEYLLAAGVVDTLHTAGTSLDAAGLAPLYRRARQDGSPTVREWGEGSLHAALEASARGLPYLPTTTAVASDVVAHNPDLAVADDPFGTGPVTVARALPVDLALVHVPAASPGRDLWISGDPGVDDVLVRAADRVVVSAESRVQRAPRTATVSRVWVDAVVELPGGAWPTPCPGGAAGDPDAAARWVRADARRPELLEQEADRG